MPKFLLNALPWLIPLLLEGVSAIRGTPENPSPKGGVSASTAQQLWEKHQQENPGNLENARVKFAEELQNAHGVDLKQFHKSVASDHSPRLGRKAIRGFKTVGGHAMEGVNLIFLYSMIKDMVSSRGESAEAGGDEMGQLMSMLQSGNQGGGMQQLARSQPENPNQSFISKLEQLSKNKNNSYGHSYGMPNSGSELDPMVSQYKELLSKVSHQEPETYMQKMAKAGYVPKKEEMWNPYPDEETI